MTTDSDPPTFKLDDDSNGSVRFCALSWFDGIRGEYAPMVTLGEDDARGLVAQLTAWLDAPRLEARESPEVVDQADADPDTRGPIGGEATFTGSGWQAIDACQHAATHRGADIPRAHGSYRSEVCDACGAFQARDHHDEVITGHNGGWRPATEYVEATSAEET